MEPADFEALRDSIIAALYTFKDPATGLPMVKKASRPDELYTGDNVKKAPDIIIEWNLDNGYSYICARSLTPGKTVEAWTDKEIADSRFMINRSGNHRQHGVFIFNGMHAAKGREFYADIQDITPTVLGLMGVPIPSDVDGRVVTEAFSDEFAAGFNATTSGEAVNEDNSSLVYTDDEEETIHERLKSLGYFE